MLGVDYNAVVMHDLDEGTTVVLTDLSALKRDANVGVCLVFCPRIAQWCKDKIFSPS